MSQNLELSATAGLRPFDPPGAAKRSVGKRASAKKEPKATAQGLASLQRKTAGFVFTKQAEALRKCGLIAGFLPGLVEVQNEDGPILLTYSPLTEEKGKYRCKNTSELQMERNLM